MVGVLGFIGSLLYVYSSDKIYEADALVQIEDEKSTLSLYSELSDAFNAESGVNAEIEIIRSRSVLGDVVEEARLDVKTEREGQSLSDYFTSFTRVFAGEARADVDPISVRSLEVNDDERRVKLNLTTTGNGGYRVYDSNKTVFYAQGEVDEVVVFDLPNDGGTVYLNLREISSKAGVSYDLTKLPRSTAIKILRERLEVRELGRNTGVLKLRIEGLNRGRIKAIVQDVADSYVRQNVEKRSAQAQRSLEFLNQQLPEVQSDLGLAESRLAAFREKNRTIDLTKETESMLSRSVSLDNQLSEIELRRAELSQNYTEEHPLLETLNEQKQQISAQKDILEEKTRNLPDLQQELLRLVRRVEVATELYTFLLNKSQELKVVKAGTVGNVRVLDAAVASVDPIKPRLVFTVVGFTSISLVFGVFLVFVRSMFAKGLWSAEQIEEIAGTAVYAVVPLSEVKTTSVVEKLGLVTKSQPNAIVSEAFRSLRTNLQLSAQAKEGCCIIGITGPAPNVGKTFVAANLAYTLSSLGHRVLFIDSDMRRGDSDKLFQVRKVPGLSQALSSGSVVHKQKVIGVDGLSVIARGKSPPDPAELLSSPGFSLLLNNERDNFDYIVVDTPPVLAVTDAVVVLKQCDLKLLVCRAGSTHPSELVESMRRFERGGVKMSGAILNGMTRSIASKGNGSYGYSYYDYDYAPTDE